MTTQPLPKSAAETEALIASLVPGGRLRKNVTVEKMPDDERLRRAAAHGGDTEAPAYLATMDGFVIGLYSVDDAEALAEYVTPFPTA